MQQMKKCAIVSAYMFCCCCLFVFLWVCLVDFAAFVCIPLKWSDRLVCAVVLWHRLVYAVVLWHFACLKSCVPVRQLHSAFMGVSSQLSEFRMLPKYKNKQYAEHIIQPSQDVSRFVSFLSH